MKELFQLQKKADEYVYMLAFNVKMRLLGIFEVSHGTGNASPSKDDLAISRRIQEVGNIISIPLIDHVIIGGCEYVTLHEKELL